MNSSQRGNSFIPRNPATLIWVQVTQILKKQKNRERSAFQKNGQQNSMLHCAVFFFVVFFVFVILTAVARSSADRSLTFTTDRIKAHSLSVRRRHHYIFAKPQHQHQLVRPRYFSCSIPEHPAGGGTGLCGVCVPDWTDPPSFGWSFPVWLLQDKIKPKWMLSHPRWFYFKHRFYSDFSHLKWHYKQNLEVKITSDFKFGGEDASMSKMQNQSAHQIRCLILHPCKKI